MKPSTFRRWILPWCCAAVGLGGFVGALEYRAGAVPVAASVAPASTVTTTVLAPPLTRTVTATAEPRVETRVLRAEAAVETRTVTVTARETPEPRETLTETVTATPADPQDEHIMQAGRKKEDGDS